MTQKQSEIQAQYSKDADLMASKSRFGFFTILPSHTAGITDYAQKKANKDQSGKVVTGVRGIYSGSKSTKVLSKTCFSQIKSPFIGCPYEDPGRHQRKRLMQQKKKWQNKQVFKPARLQKTLASGSYKYQCIKPLDKAKMFRDNNGRVITKSPNICSNPLSKLEYQRQKSFKYTQDPYQNSKIKRKQQLDADLAMRGQPFKGGSPVKDFFSNNKTIFDDTSNYKATESSLKTGKVHTESSIHLKHQTNFRPSSGYYSKYNGLFNKVTYKQEGKPKTRPQTAGKIVKHSQNFKSMVKVINSRPCPSVSTSKMNLMRCMR